MAFVRGPFGLRSHAARYGSGGTVFAAALVCLLWGGAAGSAIVPVPPGKLVATGDDGLYVLNTNGTGMRRITRSEFDSDPVWSPDGSRIVFERIGGRGATLMIVGSDGSGLRVLSDDVALAPMPRWSPDGKRLAYGGCGGICVLDLVTGARKSFLSGPETVGVDWSPDGKRIVFGGTAALNVVNVQTNARTTIGLPSAAGGAWHPAWSADGSSIAFLGRDDELLYLAGVSGGLVRPLAHASSVEVATPDWAPNAPLIAYTHGDAVHVVSATILRDVRLSDDRFGAADPSWTTNGEGLVFVRTRIAGKIGATDLWYVALSGGARRITSPYPSGASFTEPAFAKGSVRAVPAARGQRKLKLSTVASHTIKNEIVAVVPAGAGAAVATFGEFHTCGPNLVWNPPSRRVMAVPDDCGDAQGIGALAAAPELVAWTYCQQTNTTDFCALVAGRPGAPPRTLAGGEGVPQPGNLNGDGAHVVFQTWRGKRHPTTLWHVVAHPKPRIERLAERPFTDNIRAVDGGKILLRESARKLTLLDARARPIRSLRVRTGLGDRVFLTGDTLVVVRSGSISVFDARSGRLRHDWRLVGDAPWVESVRGDLAAYVSGIALHLLRLDTGVDRIVVLPRVGARPSAALSRRGLFVGYSAIDSPRPGRLLLLRIR